MPKNTYLKLKIDHKKDRFFRQKSRPFLTTNPERKKCKNSKKGSKEGQKGSKSIKRDQNQNVSKGLKGGQKRVKGG